MGGVLTPEVTLASREKRWISELPLVPGDGGRESGREGGKRRETHPAPGRP